MKTIGLIGGMSWESTLVYYRLLNEGVRARLGALHSADVLLRSLDFESVVSLQKAGRWDAAGALLGSAGAGLARAGADCVLICTNTMHLVSEAVATGRGRAADRHHRRDRAAPWRAAGCRRPLLLAHPLHDGAWLLRRPDAAQRWHRGDGARGGGSRPGARRDLRRTLPRRDPRRVPRPHARGHRPRRRCRSR